MTSYRERLKRASELDPVVDHLRRACGLMDQAYEIVWDEVYEGEDQLDNAAYSGGLLETILTAIRMIERLLPAKSPLLAELIPKPIEEYFRLAFGDRIELDVWGEMDVLIPANAGEGGAVQARPCKPGGLITAVRIGDWVGLNGRRATS